MFSLTREKITEIHIADLVKQFGTPTYIYDAERIEQRIADLSRFDVVRYAQKACSNLGVLDIVRRAGAFVDTVSAGEIHRALLAGYTPHAKPTSGDAGNPSGPPPIVFTADIFDAAALEMVLEHRIHVNCGSPDMIDQYGERAPGNNITLRINPGFGHGHSQKTNTGGEQSKHGIWHDQLDDCLRRADQHGIGISGLHIHIGSGTDFEHLSQVCQAMESAAEQVGRTITSISAGGGLPVPYREDESFIDLDRYFELWSDTRNKLQDRFGHAVTLEIEPGRYLSAESGYLLTEIRAIKRMGANTFYLVDAGFNDLARPILYGAYHPISLAIPNDKPRQTQEVVVGGPLCESGDIFTQEDGGYVRTRNLPIASVGEYLVIENAGAYGAVMGSNYNSKPLAAEVVIKNGAPHLTRRRQTLDDVVRNEQIPDW